MIGQPTLAKADNAIYFYYYSSQSLTEFTEYPSGFAIADEPGAPTELNGKTWVELLNSPNSFGNSNQPAVAAFNWVYGSAVLYQNTPETLWSFSVTQDLNEEYGSSFTLNGGPLNSENIPGNPKLLGVGSILAFLHEGQVIGYNSEGEFLENAFAFETLTGGSYNGASLPSILDKVFSFDSQIYVINPDGNAEMYDIFTGESNEILLDMTFTGGPVDGMNFEQAIASGYFLGMNYTGGYYFLGEAIPEPSTYALIGTGLCMSAF